MLTSTQIAMICIAIIAVTALLMHLDSNLVTAAIAGIAGLGGYELGKAA